MTQDYREIKNKCLLLLFFPQAPAINGYSMFTTKLRCQDLELPNYDDEGTGHFPTCFQKKVRWLAFNFVGNYFLQYFVF